MKAGKVTVSHIRDLMGVISREKAEIGAFLSLEPPTSPMRREAASAGFYESPWGKHPRIQLLTIEDLLGGKSIDYPQATDVTFKKAQRVRPNPSEKQKILPLEGRVARKRLAMSELKLVLYEKFDAEAIRAKPNTMRRVEDLPDWARDLGDAPVRI